MLGEGKSYSSNARAPRDVSPGAVCSFASLCIFTQGTGFAPLTQKHEELRLYSPCGHSHLGAEVSGAQDTERLSGFEQGCRCDLRAPSKGRASPGAAFHTLQFGGCSDSLGRLGTCFPSVGSEPWDIFYPRVVWQLS